MHDLPSVDGGRAEAIVQAVQSELPGMEAAIRPLVHAILAFVADADAREDGVDGGGIHHRPVRGVVIEGPSGVGKTSLARAGAFCLLIAGLFLIPTPHPQTDDTPPSIQNQQSHGTSASPTATWRALPSLGPTAATRSGPSSAPSASQPRMPHHQRAFSSSTSWRPWARAGRTQGTWRTWAP